MTATALTPTTTSTSPNRNGLLAVFGAVDAAVLTAVGTFTDITGNEPGADHQASDWFVCLGIIAVATAVVFGLVVRTAAAGNPGRRGVILGVLSVLTVAVAWSGLPMVLAAGALACAFLRKDRNGAFGPAGIAILVDVALATVGAIAFAVAG